MNKILFVFDSVYQFGLWLFAIAIQFLFLENFLRFILGRSYYTTYGSATEPFIFFYYLVVAIILGLIIIARSKMIQDEKVVITYITIGLTLDFIIFLIVTIYFISAFNFVV